MTRTLVSFLVWSALLGAAQGTYILSDDFSGGVFHQPWLFADNSGNSPPDATIISTGLNNLRFQTPLPAFDPFVSGVIGFGNPNYAFTDAVVRATVFPLPNTPKLAGGTGTSDNDIGIALRLNPLLGTGYSLVVDYVAGSLTLSRLGVGGQFLDLDFPVIPGFDPTQPYTIELSAIGPQLTGRVYDGSTLLATANAVDSSYTSGLLGLGAQINNNPGVQTYLGAGFDDFSAIVPEPSASVLTLLAAASAIVFSTRRMTRRSTG
jgi:hypothetical protein